MPYRLYQFYFSLQRCIGKKTQHTSIRLRLRQIRFVSHLAKQAREISQACLEHLRFKAEVDVSQQIMKTGVEEASDVVRRLKQSLCLQFAAYIKKRKLTQKDLASVFRTDQF